MSNQLPDTFDCQSELKITCPSDDGCASTLIPGDTVRVEIDLAVGLPMLPTSVFGAPTTVALHSVHDEVVDSFRARR